jgi:phage-related protein
MAIDMFLPVAYTNLSPAPAPDSGMDVDFDPTIISHQFGDAYAQEANVGINPNMKTYSPRWTNLKKAEADYIINFLEARLGTKPFYWKPNEEGAIKVFKCKKMNYKWKSGRKCDITATFKQAAPQ